jgi:hypothetical protein
MVLEGTKSLREALLVWLHFAPNSLPLVSGAEAVRAGLK